MTDPTDLDLARLLTFATLHNGHLPDVPRGVYPTYERLSKAGLVTLTETQEELQNGNVAIYLDATITPRGREVAVAMLGAGRAAMGAIPA